ncbi:MULTISPECIES: M23 family metallopeptidase [unclassified Streptomyces]|uniref:M23 family metallopeptidase n=1 Tax=unclassified Streptomyces TaxID=2593676 RepID=UPI0007EE122D|nr:MULTISPECIES: M23 family metallopeptidase [unclassified Streptomyces]MCP3769728.1 M23 family metallopeptidase [Streptomyces sp. MAR25Y5]OBQ49402.1 peptidase [Streptomyces sp. H-KF8]
MSQRVTSRSFLASHLRTRAAVLAAGMGVTAVVGAGIAAAADTTAAHSTSTTAKAVQTQADVQAKAAKTKAAEVQKTAEVKKATEVKKAAKPAQPAKKKASWVDPVKKYTVSATYAQAGGMWQSAHSGQDFAVPNGTKVMATHGGTVVKAGGNGAGDGPAYGNAVVINHGNGTYSQYAHLSQVNVQPGQVVKTGQKIALSGNTGNSSGPHLHFEIRTGAHYGSAIDPVKFLRGKGVNF